MNKESVMPEDEQREKHIAHEKYVPLAIRVLEAHDLQAKMDDPFIFRIWKLLDHNKCSKLANHESFVNICQVMAEQVRRITDTNKKLKHGMRYPCEYINFMVLMRSYGQKSAQQYGIFRYLVKHSPNCLSNPELDFENVAHVKRLMDTLKYTGPVAVAGDCTKVRAILVKIPLPQIPPLVIALRPTKGNDNAHGIHEELVRFLAMAKRLEMAVISMSADGAASELAVQALMYAEKSDLSPLSYDYPLYGVHLHAPVFATMGPLISVQDLPHAPKTCRNQPQYGTHTASLGKERRRGCLTYVPSHGLSATTMERLDGSRDVRPEFIGLLVYLFIFGELFDAWLNRRMSAQERVLAALQARFFLHIWAHHHYPTQPFCPWLLGTKFVKHFFSLARSLLPDFTYAELLKLVKHVMLHQHILLTGTIQSSVRMPDYILNGLVILGFKEASQICKQIFLMAIPSKPLNLAPLGTPAPPSASQDGLGDDMDDEDDDSSGFEHTMPEEDNLNNEETLDMPGNNTAPDEDESDASTNATHYAAQYLALLEDYKEALDQLPDLETTTAMPHPAPPTAPNPSATIIPLVSKIFDEGNKVSVARIVNLRQKHQSGTSTCHQEKTVHELRWQGIVKRVQAEVSEKGHFVIMRSSITPKLLYIGKILNLYKYVSRRHGSINSASGLSGLSYFLLRVYLLLTIGGASHNSNELSESEEKTNDETDDKLDLPTYFSWCHGSLDLFTHGFAHELVYHLAPNIMKGPPTASTLKPWAAAQWSIVRKMKFVDPKAKASDTSGNSSKSKTAAGQGAVGKGKSAQKK
ncbi:hypothetical protein C2E23DRAFT_861950 [Lenzites betulinus]|nr:hypothetical protein C2E23DRAFT_861950 [Lenzites betulinus]